MRATVAKRIRRQVYGTGHHPRVVTYRWGIPYSAEKSQKAGVKARLKAGVGICLIADNSRRAYREAKKQYKQATP